MNSNKGSDISNMIGSSDRGDTWAEWSRHVLIELDRLNKCYRVLDDKVDKLTIDFSIDLAKLKLQAGIWGLLAGAIPPTIALIIALAVYYLRNPSLPKP